MRTLILTCSTGGGHNTCAAAIAQAYHRRGLVCDVADALEFTSLRLSRFISWGHNTMYRCVPDLFRRGYRFAERHPGTMDNDAVVRMMRRGARRLHEYLQDGRYDAVICVHVFAGLMLRQVRREFPVTLRTGFVATDYTCSPGAAAGELDRYFIPHEALMDEFAAQGIPREKLVAGGIPVDPRFGAARQQRTRSGRHMVMMCGSMGCGPMEELAAFFADRLPQDAALTVVCGSNEKLYRRVAELTKGHPNIAVCGFVRDMVGLLDDADLCLTKPGGLSATELAVMGVPMVLIDAVAGCEAYNMAFFLQCGGAVTADGIQALGERCLALLDDPVRRADMARQLRAVSKPDAAETVCAVMINLGQKEEARNGCMDLV